MNQTQNYQLPQWEASDRVTRSDVNGAFAAIDTALAALSGGARIAAGSYTGDGTYGSANPSSLTFPFVPKLVLLFGPTAETVDAKYFTICLPQKGSADLCYGAGDYVMRHVTVSGSTIRWYGGNQFAQYNGSGKVYFWVAIG